MNPVFKILVRTLSGFMLFAVYAGERAVDKICDWWEKC